MREAMMKVNDKAAAQAGACVAEREPKREEWTRRKRLGEDFFFLKKKRTKYYLCGEKNRQKMER